MGMTKEKIKENKEYLDSVALVTMETYLQRSPLKGFNDSMSVARISYKQALAMLEVRENGILSLADESGVLKKDKSNE